MVDIDGKLTDGYLAGMSAYYTLKAEREKGGLSSNEEFFLDSVQATVIADGLISVATAVKEKVETAKNNAVDEVEELFNSTKLTPFTVTELSPSEIQEAYAEAGVTYDSIVGKTESHFAKKVSKAESIVTAYTDLQANIQAVVEDALSKDAKLAGDFQRWSVK